MSVRILIGDMRERLKELPDNSVDSVVCDPPYELGFMGKSWDSTGVANDQRAWAEVLRALKPGGQLVAFSGTRTYHRMAVAIEDAGFEVRDMIAWHYGSGFPKSHDISKAIDKTAGAEREVVGIGVSGKTAGMQRLGPSGIKGGEFAITSAVTEAAREWEGWGTALKPATEPVLCGAKPVTVEQHFAIILHELTVLFAEAVQWSNSSASDAEKSFTATLAKLHAAASSVLDSAKIRSLASIGIASCAARSFTLQPLASDALTRTRGGSALSHVRPSGSRGRTKEPTTLAGEVVDTLTALLDMSMSVTAGDMSENIAWSWLSISDAILSQANKFTIETASRLTTALRTLRFSLLSNTSDDTGNSGPDTQPICLARKPLSEKSIAANVLKWGTGAINVDGCRVEGESTLRLDNSRMTSAGKRGGAYGAGGYPAGEPRVNGSEQGRWPANLVHDGSDEVVAGFPAETGVSSGGQASKPTGYGEFGGGSRIVEKRDPGFGDSGSAARFFYCAKATTEERGEGNNHPTVKPVALMRWLVCLVTPKGGTVLDPFMGSGSTGLACQQEQFDFIGCEMSLEYAAIAERRMRADAGLFAEVKAA